MQILITLFTRNELRKNKVYLEPKNSQDIKNNTRPNVINTKNQDNMNINSKIDIINDLISEKFVKRKLKKTFCYARKDNKNYII
jgi:hypothetical protein